MTNAPADTYLAVVNPAAGGGRCRKLVGPALQMLRAGGIKIEVRETSTAGDGIAIAREEYARGYRKFIAVGGDGTSYEIVNGLFPMTLTSDPPTLAFLPLGTGNSFLREFTDSKSSDQAVDFAMQALLRNRSRACDVMRLIYRGGTLYYINLLSVGFTADVAALRIRRFAGWGEPGYQASIFITLARFRRRPFPLEVDGDGKIDGRRCLFLTFNNSKYTGGTMLIAPQAQVDDGLIEYVRWGPIGRAGLIRNLPTLYDGTHVHHPLAERRAAKCIDFHFESPVDVMVDGEVLTLHCQKLDVLPSALRVVV